MVTIIVLSIFVVVFGIIFFFMYRWWQNYGKTLYNMLKTMGQMNQMLKNPPKATDIQKQMNILQKLLKKK